MLMAESLRSSPTGRPATTRIGAGSPRTTPKGARSKSTIKPSATGSPQQRSPSKRTPTTAAVSEAPSAGSTSKFRLHFAGRVYRPLDETSPKEARDMYTREGNWLGQPDERSKDDDDALIDCPCGSQSGSSLSPPRLWTRRRLRTPLTICYCRYSPLPQSTTRR